MNLLPSAPTDWASLHLAFEEMASSGNAEVREGGEWLAELATFRWEIRPDGRNPLLHIWSDDCNYIRRLLDIKERTPDRSFWKCSDSAVLSPRGLRSCGPHRLVRRPAQNASDFAPPSGGSWRNPFLTGTLNR